MNSSIFLKLPLLLLLLLTLAGGCFSQQVAAPDAQKNAPAMTEEDRLPFMQDEQAAAAPEATSGSLLLRTLGAMLLIIGLIFFGAWGLKKFGFGKLKSGPAEESRELSVVSSITLGNGQTISSVKFGEKILLVGSTAQSFTLLAEESEQTESFAPQPRSVADLIAEEETGFAEKFEQAQMRLNSFEGAGGSI